MNELGTLSDQGFEYFRMVPFWVKNFNVFIEGGDIIKGGDNTMKNIVDRERE